jgi:hypothetical protein
MYKKVSGFLGSGFRETRKPAGNPRKRNLDLHFADALPAILYNFSTYDAL